MLTSSKLQKFKNNLLFLFSNVVWCALFVYHIVCIRTEKNGNTETFCFETEECVNWVIGLFFTELFFSQNNLQLRKSINDEIN